MKILLRWGARCLWLAGLALLGYCAVLYVRARLFQVRQGPLFQPVPAVAQHPALVPLVPGLPIGRIDIPRIGLSAVVVEGDSARSLRLAAGHIPGTALPGQPGNAAIAGHRDTFFRSLRNIRPQDWISVTTLYGSYKYSVESTRVVSPGDVQVLNSSSAPTLTLVTCYPFYFVGPAPRRFIVRARLVTPNSPASQPSPT